MSLIEALARLETTNGFYVRQNWNALEQVLPVYEQENTYEVFNIPKAQNLKHGLEGDIKIFHAKESTACCMRFCCGKNRGFNFIFEAPQSKESFVRMSRKFRCCGWAVIPCCAHEVHIHSAIHDKSNRHRKPGDTDELPNVSDMALTGNITVPAFHGGCLTPTMHLHNDEHEKIGSMTGNSIWFCPCVICDLCGSNFKIYKDHHVVGEVKKLGVSNCKDCLYQLNTEADNYFVEFNDQHLEKLDVNFKLAVLASVLQIDFTFYESKRGLSSCHCCDIYCCGWALPCCPAWCVVLGACICCKNGKKKEKKEKHRGLRNMP